MSNENTDVRIDNDPKQGEYFIIEVDKLVPYANNARTHSKAQIDQIAASIRAFGYMTPITIDENNTILSGHGRYYALQKLGIKKIPCMRVSHLTENEKKAYIIADNKIALNAEWDEDMLKVDIADLEAADFDMDLLGFSEKEMKSMFGSDGEDAEDDFDLSSALEQASFVQKGDVWTVGRHRLMCGDATSMDDVATLMDGKKANLLLTDPPYGVSFKSSSGLTIQNDSMKNEEFYQFLYDAFTAAAGFLGAGASAYVFHADTEGLNFRKAFIDAGFHLAGCCIWVKDSLVLGRSDYQWQHEPVLYGFLQNGKHSWYSDRKQTTVWNFAKPKRNANHPTSKPLDLLSYPIGNSTQENGIVLDTFGGSGSTMMACEQTNRICYMMELDEKYASVILRRAVEDGISPDDIFALRDGVRYGYADLVKEVDHGNA